MIVCGWCGQPATEACPNCRRDPRVPWVQRGEEPPVIPIYAGRPTLDAAEIRIRLQQARANLGPGASAADVAEHLDISVRTLGRWQKVSGFRAFSAAPPPRG